MSVKRTGTRYDRFTPNAVDEERFARTSGLGYSLSYQTRYCETCKRDVPFRRTPQMKSKAVKGWKCPDCRAKPTNGDQPQ